MLQKKLVFKHFENIHNKKYIIHTTPFFLSTTINFSYRQSSIHHSSLHPQCLAEGSFLLNHLHGQSTANAEQDERSPLPPERVNQDDKEEPVDQFRVREEVKGTGRGESFHQSCPVDPSFHTTLCGLRQWVDQEHQEESSVDTNVHVTHSANSIDVGAVVGADTGVLGWKDLEVPTGCP